MQTAQGEHRYYLAPNGLSGRTTKRGETRSFDVFASGFVVAPPSRHRLGVPYVWKVPPKNASLQQPPVWIVGLLSQRSTTPIDCSRLFSVDISNLRVPDRIKKLMREGQNTDRQRYPSRSEAVFAVTSALVSAGYDDPTIASVLMAPENNISEKPREKGYPWVFSEITRAREKTQSAVSHEIPWPTLSHEAYHGLAGEIVHTIEPHTEADPVALLAQTLVAFGNALGPTPYFSVEADKHFMKLFVVLVGMTSKSRKGTSWGYARRLFEACCTEWLNTCVQSGLSSGEGLIWAVRDPITRQEPIREKSKIVGYQEIQIDPGVSDKRVLVFEPEFASTLRVLERDGNTLSAIIRQAWDTGNLRAMTKNTPATSTGSHISIIGHVTRDELRRYLTRTEAGNGFANRFLWLCVKRSKVLPEGGKIKQINLRRLIERLQDAIQFSQALQDELKLDEEARTLWCEIYPELSDDKPGLLGAVTSRAEAQTMRLSCLYALLDQSAVIRKEHLCAALALWEYSKDSCRYIFGDVLGDPIADTILDALRCTPQGLTRTELHNLFKRHMDSSKLVRALQLLSEHGLAYPESKDSGGRPTELWYAQGTAKKAN